MPCKVGRSDGWLRYSGQLCLCARRCDVTPTTDSCILVSFPFLMVLSKNPTAGIPPDVVCGVCRSERVVGPICRFRLSVADHLLVRVVQAEKTPPPQQQQQQQQQRRRRRRRRSRKRLRPTKSSSGQWRNLPHTKRKREREKKPTRRRRDLRPAVEKRLGSRPQIGAAPNNYRPVLMASLTSLYETNVDLYFFNIFFPKKKIFILFHYSYALLVSSECPS